MESLWTTAILFLIGLCNGLPINLENSGPDPHTQFLTGLVAVLLTICSVVLLAGCLCCQRKNGFKEFRDGPVASSATIIASNQDHGHVNPIANSSSEFTIFTPISPPHHNNNVFLANQRIVNCSQEDYKDGDIDATSWFDGSEKDFPRTKLKYIRELGKGWFGRVVEGTAQNISEDPSDPEWTPVVVRILEASATSREKLLFLNDAAIYKRGYHPNILRILGRSLDTVPLLLLQEYCPQGDLKKYLRMCKSSQDKLVAEDMPLRWCYQLTLALKFLHDQKLTHPDLAARNCQLSEDLSLKLGDYGLSAVYYPEDYYQGSPGVPLRWCAPEIISYTSTTIQTTPTTTESNVWALGVTMWEILEWGEQPYVGLTDDEVISQVLGAPKVRLTRPTYRLIYTEYLYKIMQSCWYNVESRVTVSQIDLMMTDLMHVFENTKLSLDLNSDIPHEGEPISLEDFDMRWNALKPNSPLTKEAESLELRPNQNQQKQDRAQKSASLNNLHGSLDNLLDTRQFDPMESWLENVASDTSDMSFVRGLSEAITDLDNAIAMQNMSSSPEFGKDKVAGGTQFTSSESETEDENWRKKIERGAYTEKVRQKSRSVADLMVLTHIDCSESDSETLPSLDYKVNQQRVRYLKSVDNQKKFGSEGNLFHAHDNTFREELKKMQEERRDSLLFVPDKFSECSFSEEGVAATANNRLDSLENSPVKKLMEKLNSPSEMVPPQQVYNVFNVRVRHVNVGGAVCDKVRENTSRSVDYAADTICDRQLESKVLELEQSDNKLLYNQNDGSPSHIKTVYDPFEDAESLLTRKEGRIKTGVTYPSKKREDKVSVAYKPNSTNEKIVRSETVGEFKLDQIEKGDPIVDYNLSKGHAIDASKKDNNFEVKIEILNEQKNYDNVTNDVSPKEIFVTSKENSKNIKLKVPKLSEIIQRNAIDYKVHHHHHHHHSGSNEKTSVISKSEENEKAVHQEIIDKDSGLNTPENSASLEKLYDDNEEILDIGSFDSDRSNETTNNRGVLLTDISNEEESSTKEKQDDKEEISEIIDFCIKNETRLICDLFLAHERSNHLEDCKKENVSDLAKKYAFFDYDYRHDMQNFIDTEVYHSSNLLNRPRLLGGLENDKMMIRCIDVNMKESEDNAIGVDENRFGDISKEDVLHGFNTEHESKCDSTRLELEVLKIDCFRLKRDLFENINDINATRDDDDNSQEFPAYSVSEEKFKNQNISPNLSKQLADNQKNTSDQIITVVNDKIINGKCVKFDQCVESVVLNEITPVRLESDLRDEKMTIFKATGANPSDEKATIFKEIILNSKDEHDDSDKGINLFDTEKNEESTREEIKHDEGDKHIENLHTTKLFLDKEIENYVIRKVIEDKENGALMIANETGQNISITVEDEVAKYDATIKMEENHTSALIPDDKNNVNNRPKFTETFTPRLINDSNEILVATKSDPQLSDDRNTSKVIEEIKTCETSKLDRLEHTIDMDSNVILNDTNQILVATGSEPQIGDDRNTSKVIQETIDDHPLNSKVDLWERTINVDSNLILNDLNQTLVATVCDPQVSDDWNTSKVVEEIKTCETSKLDLLEHTIDVDSNLILNDSNQILVATGCDPQVSDDRNTSKVIQEITDDHPLNPKLDLLECTIDMDSNLILNDSNQTLVAMGCEPQVNDDRNTSKVIQETTDDHPLNPKLDRLERTINVYSDLTKNLEDHQLSIEPNLLKYTEDFHLELLKDCDYFSPKTQSNVLDLLGCIKNVDSEPSIRVNHINSELDRLRDVDVNCDSVKDSELSTQIADDTRLCGSLNKSKQIQDVDSLFVKDFEQIGLETNDPVCEMGTELELLNDIQLPTDSSVVPKRIEDVALDFVKDSVRLSLETNVQVHQTRRKSDPLNDTQLCGTLNNPKQIEDVDSLFVKDFEQIGLETNDPVCEMGTELELLNDIQLPTDSSVVPKRIEDVALDFVNDSVRLSPEINVQVHQTCRKSDPLYDTQLSTDLDVLKHIQDVDSAVVDSDKIFPKPSIEVYHQISRELNPLKDIEDIRSGLTQESDHVLPEPSNNNQSGTEQKHFLSELSNDNQPSTKHKHIEDLIDSDLIHNSNQILPDKQVCNDRWDTYLIRERTTVFLSNEIINYEDADVKGVHDLTPTDQFVVLPGDKSNTMSFEEPNFEDAVANNNKDRNQIDEVLESSVDDVAVDFNNFNRDLNLLRKEENPVVYLGDDKKGMKSDESFIEAEFKVGNTNVYSPADETKAADGVTNYHGNSSDVDGIEITQLIPSDSKLEQTLTFLNNEIKNYNLDRNLLVDTLDNTIHFSNESMEPEKLKKSDLEENMQSPECDKVLIEKSYKLEAIDLDDTSEGNQQVQNDHRLEDSNAEHIHLTNFIREDPVSKQTQTFLNNEIENYDIFHKRRRNSQRIKQQNQLEPNPFVGTLDNTEDLAIECLEPEILNEYRLERIIQSKKFDEVLIDESDKLEAVNCDDVSEGNQQIENYHRLDDNNIENIHSTSFSREDPVSKQTQTFLNNEIENYDVLHKRTTNSPGIKPQNQLDPDPFVGTLDNTQDLLIECLEPETLNESRLERIIQSKKFDEVLIDESDKLEVINRVDVSEGNQQIENYHQLDDNNAENIHSISFSREDPVVKQKTQTFLNNEIENYAISGKEAINLVESEAQRQLVKNLGNAVHFPSFEWLESEELNELDIEENVQSKRFYENLINETYKLEETDLDDVSEGNHQIDHYHLEDNNIQSTTFILKDDSIGEQTKTFLSNEIENYDNFDNIKIESNRNLLEFEATENSDDTHRRMEFNQNILDTSIPPVDNINRSDEINETSTFLQNEIENYAGNERRVDFDLSDTQEKMSLNSLTHISTFTSTPFANRRPNDSAVILGASDDYSIDYYSGLKTSVDPEEGADLQFSSNFVRPSNAANDLYSLETWDNFLGRSFDEQESATVDFNDFSQEPHSLLFLECDENGARHANELKMTKVLEETYNAGDVPASNETFVVEKKEEENADDQIETDPGKSVTNTTTTGGWFLHPQTKESSNKTEESTPPTTTTTTTTTTTAATTTATTTTTTATTSTTTTREESYVGFSMDDEIMAAIRNELLTKLPHAQRASSDHQIDENCEEMDSAERNEVFLRYNVYNTPLSPIPEESCDSEIASGRITPERINDTTDDEGDSSDWSVQEDNNSSNARTEEIISPRMPESPAKCRTDPYRHTPSQDSCCSNDTLFNVEELNAVPNDRTMLDPVLNLVHQLDSIEDETGESKYVDCSGDTLLTSNENAISSPGGEQKLELPEIRTEHGYILDFLDNERYGEMNTSLDAGEEVSSASDIYLTVSENTFSFGQNVAPLNSPEDRPWKELQASFRDCDEDKLPKISPVEETKNLLKRDDSLNDVNDTLDTSTPPQQDISDPITPQAPNETDLKDSSFVLRLDEAEESDDCLISDEDIDKVLREDMESEIISNEKLGKTEEDAISRLPGSNPSDGGIYVNVDEIGNGTTVPDPDETNEIVYENIDKEENHRADCDDDLYVNLFETQPDIDDRIYANLTKTESGESFNTEDSNGTDSAKVEPVAGYENLTSTARDEDAIYSKIDDTDDSDNSKFSRFEDLFGPLTDIRFSGPGNSSQMMATSFSESCDLGEDQDWDSGSDTRSSSSGEFIWKEGEHEASVKALRAPPQVENVDYVTPMENIQEEEIADSNSKDNSSSGSSSGSEGEDECPEFVPSAWDKYATPTKSALRSPEKTLERSKEEKAQRTTPKEKKSKGVWFKKQKYHCVYEYPREPESPVLQSYDLWKPTPDYATLSDWDLDAGAYLPVSLGNPEVHDTQSLRENLPRNLYNLNTFSDINVDSNVLDEDFFVSSSSKPFDMLTGLTSQFFPGRQFPGDAWADGTNVTPDSGVEDVATPATFVDETDGSYDNKNRIEPSPPSSSPPSPLTGVVQSLKVLAANAAERNGSTRRELGGLRHTRDKLKLDLPPSPSAFTSNRTFSIDTAAEEIVTRQVPTFTTFGKSRFLVQHVDTPPECGRDDKNVSFEALPHRKPETQTMLVDTGKWQLIQQQQQKRKIESVRGEASLLDSADEDSGIESCTIDRKRFNI